MVMNGEELVIMHRINRVDIRFIDRAYPDTIPSVWLSTNVGFKSYGMVYTNVSDQALVQIAMIIRKQVGLLLPFHHGWTWLKT